MTSSTSGPLVGDDRYAQLLKAGTVLLAVNIVLSAATVVGFATEFISGDMSSLNFVAVVWAALLAVLAVFVARVKPWTLALPAMGVALVLSAVVAPESSEWPYILGGFLEIGGHDYDYFGIATPVAVVALAYVITVAWIAFRRPATSTQAIGCRKLKATATTLAAATITATAEVTALFCVLMYKTW